MLCWTGPGIIGAEQFDVTLLANDQGGGAGSRGQPNQTRSDNPSLPVSSRRAQRPARQSVVATDVRIRNLREGRKVVATVPGEKPREVAELRARRPFGSPPKRCSGAPLTFLGRSMNHTHESKTPRAHRRSSTEGTTLHSLETTIGSGSVLLPTMAFDERTCTVEVRVSPIRDDAIAWLSLTWALPPGRLLPPEVRRRAQVSSTILKAAATQLPTTILATIRKRKKGMGERQTRE